MSKFSDLANEAQMEMAKKIHTAIEEAGFGQKVKIKI